MDKQIIAEDANNSKLRPCPSCGDVGPFDFFTENGFYEPRFRVMICKQCGFVGPLAKTPIQVVYLWNMLNDLELRSDSWGLRDYIKCYFKPLYGNEWPIWMMLRFEFLCDLFNRTKSILYQTEYEALRGVFLRVFKRNVEMEMLPHCGPFNSHTHLQQYINGIDQAFCSSPLAREARTERIKRLVMALAIEVARANNRLSVIADGFNECHPFDIAVVVAGDVVNEESKRDYVDSVLWGVWPQMTNDVRVIGTVAGDIKDAIMNS